MACVCGTSRVCFLDWFPPFWLYGVWLAEHAFLFNLLTLEPLRNGPKWLHSHISNQIYNWGIPGHLFQNVMGRIQNLICPTLASHWSNTQRLGVCLQCTLLSELLQISNASLINVVNSIPAFARNSEMSFAVPVYKYLIPPCRKHWCTMEENLRM